MNYKKILFFALSMLIHPASAAHKKRPFKTGHGTSIQGALNDFERKRADNKRFQSILKQFAHAVRYDDMPKVILILDSITPEYRTRLQQSYIRFEYNYDPITTASTTPTDTHTTTTKQTYPLSNFLHSIAFLAQTPGMIKLLQSEHFSASVIEIKPSNTSTASTSARTSSTSCVEQTTLPHYDAEEMKKMESHNFQKLKNSLKKLTQEDHNILSKVGFPPLSIKQSLVGQLTPDQQRTLEIADMMQQLERKHLRTTHEKSFDALDSGLTNSAYMKNMIRRFFINQPKQIISELNKINDDEQASKLLSKQAFDSIISSEQQARQLDDEYNASEWKEIFQRLKIQ